jgi:predicted DNA-binding ribbon-helix-helix protein
MICQVRPEALPASWLEGHAAERSHESRRYGTRFMLRLDDPTWATLAALSTHVERSVAAIIRQLPVQATPDSFPMSWPLRVTGRQGAQVRRLPREADHEE